MNDDTRSYWVVADDESDDAEDDDSSATRGVVGDRKGSSMRDEPTTNNAEVETATFGVI